MINTKSRIFILILLALLFPGPSYGSMSSTNYTIFADSVDAGGVLSIGGVYSLEGTLSESPVDFTTSSVYEVRGGYQAMDSAMITMTISAATINLGTLSSASVTMATTSVFVASASNSGYVLSISSISGNAFTGVADGSVTAGQQEYGISLSGNNQAFTDDRAIAANLTLASAGIAIDSDETVITFKASKSAGSIAANYSQTITL